MVLDAASDEFYSSNLYNNYGEVGLSVKEAVEKFQVTSNQHSKVSWSTSFTRIMQGGTGQMVPARIEFTICG